MLLQVPTKNTSDSWSLSQVKRCPNSRAETPLSDWPLDATPARAFSISSQNSTAELGDFQQGVVVFEGLDPKAGEARAHVFRQSLAERHGLLLIGMTGLTRPGRESITAVRQALDDLKPGNDLALRIAGL